MIRSAIFDPALSVRVLSRRALRYAAGADPAEDRPGHVRAASAVVRWGARIAIVQDDAQFLALLEDAGAQVESLSLPADVKDHRLFDDGRGNKAHKLDLEAAVVMSDGEQLSLVCFGSGATAARERLVVVEGQHARVVDAARFYAHLRATLEFAGSELNLEGAWLEGDRLWLMQRGNGAPRAGVDPVNAIGAIGRRDFVDFLHAPDAAPVPTLSEVTQYELGHVEGARLTFTDAARVSSGFMYTAAAEASPDAIHDGEVRAVVVGTVDGDSARQALVLDEKGLPVRDKIEGLAPSDRERRWLAVTDRDDPAQPSELLELELSGSW